MKRCALLIVAIVGCSATLAQAQVIGTYRPSLVTYYPSTSSVTPVAYYRPVSNPTRFASAGYSGYPVTTAGATQVIGSSPVVNTSYVGGSPYVAASPVIGGNCGCAPIQTIGGPSCYPNTAYAPVVQPVAYQQPVAYPQPIGAQNTLIDGKYYVGKGLLGRPKIYAEGQPLRNALRTILP